MTALQAEPAARAVFLRESTTHRRRRGLLRVTPSAPATVLFVCVCMCVFVFQCVRAVLCSYEWVRDDDVRLLVC